MKQKRNIRKRKRVSYSLYELYKSNKKQMKEWTTANDGKPNWTTETRLKMLSIYNVLQDRVDKSSAYFIRLIE